MASEQAPVGGSAPPGAGAALLLAGPARVRRFGASERAVHGIHAAAFTVLTGTGIVMYLPALSTRIADRPTLKAIHLTAAVAWVTALFVVALVGDRRQLRSTLAELETFDAYDRRWLGGRRRTPQGRFNAGEKAHAVVQAALAVLFLVSGVLLWLGERDTAFRLPGTIAVHDGAMYVAVVLVLGHLYLALVHPPTRPALRGIVQGDVDAAWAREHHARWDAPDAAVPAPPPAVPSRVAATAAVACATAGLAVVLFVVL
jgi:formate dehydrogenase subunit gamma